MCNWKLAINININIFVFEGTWLNDKNAEKTKELFFNKPLYSDITFEIEGLSSIDLDWGLNSSSLYLSSPNFPLYYY